MRDSSIHWTRKRLLLYPFLTNGLSQSGSTPFEIEGAETATIGLATISTFGMVGLSIPAAGVLCGRTDIPLDLDPKFPIGFRFRWTADVSGTSASLGVCVMLADAIRKGAAIIQAATAMNTALGTQLYKDSAGAAPNTDFLYQVSSRAIKNSIGVTRKQIEEGAMLAWSLTLGSFTAITTAILLAVEMDYAAMRTLGSGSHVDQPLSSQG